MTALETVGLLAETMSARLLHPTDLDVAAGEVVAVLGESGSGKSTLGLALLGGAAPGVRLGGQVLLGGAPLVGPDEPTLRRTRAGRIAHLPQHPGTVLDPVRRVGRVLEELAALVHRDRRARSVAVEAACGSARLDTALLRRFPHQLSGGQQQRAALAQTLVTGPGVLVLDEPTTGLDPGTTAELLTRLAALRASGTAIVLVTHDHDVARTLADRAVVLDGGRIVRRGTAADVLGVATSSPPQRTLVTGALRLEVRDAAVVDAAGRPVLRGVDLDAAAGELVAVVGPSGAGKTTLGRHVAGLVNGAGGSVRVDGELLPARVAWRTVAQRRAVQYVHQDPRATFRAHLSVVEQVARPAVLLRGVPRLEALVEATGLLELLGVAAGVAGRRPGTLSGGQLQRAAVARAFVARPAVLVCDEVTSALDADHRDRLLDALDALRRTHGTTVLLISHDRVLVDRLADRVVGVDDGHIRP